jgi:hypothetical protein
LKTLAEDKQPSLFAAKTLKNIDDCCGCFKDFCIIILLQANKLVPK